MRTQLPVVLATLAGSLVACSGAAHAQAFYLQEQSAKGAGRAFSGEAADRDADSLWWNPAAAAGTNSTEITVNASAILPAAEVHNVNTQITRPGQPSMGVGGNPISFNPIDSGILPSGSVSVPLGNRLAVGLTLTSPYSFTTNYADTSWARYLAERTRLRTYDIQPSVGVALTPWLRIGAAANIERTEATLTNALPNLSPLLPDGQQSLTGKGWDLGWSAGAQLGTGRFTLGVSYKSSIKHKLNGTVAVSGLLGPLAGQNFTLSGVDATFRTPSQIIVGARFAATDKLTLDAQAVRFGWDKFDAINIGSPINSVTPENYKNSWSWSGGFDYQVIPAMTLRAGFQYAETPIPDGMRDPRVPDSDRMNFATGASFKVTPGFTIDAAANYIKFQDTPIDRSNTFYAGTPAQTTVTADGMLRDANAVVLSIGGRISL